MHIRALPASTTVAQPPISISGWVCFAFSIAERISLSLPTPVGSTKITVGWYLVISSSMASWKSPARVQQMQPALSSLTWMPTSFRKAPSTPTSPYSFSSSTTFSLRRRPVSSFLIRVVLPAPRKPEIT